MPHRPKIGVIAVSVLLPQLAWGQSAPTNGGATVGTVPVGAVQPPQPGSTYVVQPGASGNRQTPTGPLGGGNANESSAHPVVGDEEDSFDLGTRGREAAAHGEENGPIFVGAPLTLGGNMPSTHVVRRGDTLWALCDAYYKNPYEWPRVWSYNPQIKNPHWIYPGDEVRLRRGGADSGAPRTGSSVLGNTPGGTSLVDRRRQVADDTIFLRDQGWIRDPSDQVWGEVTGSSEDKMYLSDFDEVYLHVDTGHDVRLGQELTIFRPLNTSAAGTIVQIQGTARIDQWNAQDRVARAQVVETLNVIERGAKIGPLARSFEVVPARRNESDAQAHVLASVHPNEFWGQNQVVFIDQGEAAGLQLGNRLFIIRKGDAWRQSLVTPGAGNRVSPDDEKPMPPMETTPSSKRDEPNYPDEIVGELRVVALKKDTATCVVTQSKLEIEPRDLAVARKGY